MGLGFGRFGSLKVFDSITEIKDLMNSQAFQHLHRTTFRNSEDNR